jgi:RND superfamily putative drug exporter
MLVVFTAMVGSLTVLRALLGKLGDRVERGIVAVGAAELLRVLRLAGRQPSWLVRLRERQTWLRRAKGDPSTLGTLGDATYAVTGETAGTHDFNQTMKARFPLVFLFVLGLAFLLLLFTFRSIVVPLTAIVLNLLSVAASYGVLVWIFQDGHLQGLLGFHSNGAIVTWLPLFLFTVLFGLSMDYHVFIVSRIKELVDRGESNVDAVAHGIRRTASTVTAAAAVMVAVFAIFASLRTLDIKQLGVGLGVAVLLDATIIRGVLLPATMKLLGDWNWYLPRSLAWLPRLTPEAGEAAPALE